MKRMIVIATVFVAVMALALTASARTKADVERTIVKWAEERIAELKEKDKNDQAAGWREQIEKENYEALAASLIAHFVIAKQITEALIPAKLKVPKLREKVAEYKRRLATLGWYVNHINE